ncbi:MAG: hypothetical protein ABW224_01435 [Kibdelosporangium sp.]
MAGEPAFTIVDPPRSIFRRKRFLLPFGIATATALVSVVALLAAGAVAMSTTVVEALMASKVEYFNDPQVKRILMANGIQVHVTNSGGSMGVNTNKRKKANEYDFVMPSGQMVGEAVHKALGGERYFPFTSPLVLGAFREYADALVHAKVARKLEPSLYYSIDIAAFSKLPESGKPLWKDHELPGNSNQMIAQSPDPCQSYSGAAYVALVAFAENGDRTMKENDLPAIAAKVKPVLSVEGQHESGLGTKFFNQEGRTFAPVAVFYEHQYLAYQFRTLEKTGRTDDDRVLLYPEARHTTDPWLIAYTEAGSKVGELLEDNAELRARALELGYQVPGLSLDGLLGARGMAKPRLSETESFMPKSSDLAKLIGAVYGCDQVDVSW